jgi:hypothetical protein
MIGQRAATGAALFGPRAPQCRIRPLLISLLGGESLLEVLQPQVELIGIELLGTLAELHPLKLADQVAQTIVLASQPIALSGKLRLLGPFGITLGMRLPEQRMQRCDVIGKGLGGRVHGPD